MRKYGEFLNRENIAYGQVVKTEIVERLSDGTERLYIPPNYPPTAARYTGLITATSWTLPEEDGQEFYTGAYVRLEDTGTGEIIYEKDNLKYPFKKAQTALTHAVAEAQYQAKGFKEVHIDV